MKVIFIKRKPEWLMWLYYLAFGIGLIIAVPFIAMAIVTCICTYIAQWWVGILKKVLNIDFDV